MKNSNPYSAPQSSVTDSIDEKNNYSLSKSNKIFYGFVAVISTTLFFIYSNNSAEQIGQQLGRLFGLLVFPAIFGWIVWRLTGKKKNGGSITFNIILALAVLGQISTTIQNSQKSEQINSLQKHSDSLRETFSNTDDQNEINEAYKEYTGNIENSLNELSKQSTGTEKQFYKILEDFVSNSQVVVQDWQQSFMAVNSDRILNYSILNNADEFNHQRGVLNDYINKTKIYNASFNDTIPDLKKQLSVLGKENSLAKGAIKSATEKHQQQKVIFEPLMKTHLEYGSNLIGILNLLEKNQGEWSEDNGQLVFNNDTTLAEFNLLIEKATLNENSINSLADQLIKTL